MATLEALRPDYLAARVERDDARTAAGSRAVFGARRNRVHKARTKETTPFVLRRG